MRAPDGRPPGRSNIIRTESLSKVYQQGVRAVPVLRDLSLAIADGEFIALMGTSGAGKTTLMNILGCLDRPSSGQYWLDGTEVSGFEEEDLAVLRNQKLGFVFQTSHFVDYLDLAENVALPGFYARRRPAGTQRRRALELLGQVGLGHRTDHVPAALSGGERQRVAIARALFNEPSVILADEPTGNLDAENTERVMQLFEQLSRAGKTLVLVTHDRAVAGRAGRTIELHGGTVHGQPVH